MEPSVEKIEERIRKLLALATNNTNAAEAESAMAKVRELMLQHAIDSMPDATEKPDVVVVTIDVGRVFYNWQKRVQAAVSHLYDGQCVFTERWQANRWVDVTMIVCSKYDEPYVKPTWIEVMGNIERAARQYSKQPAVRNSYLSGAADGFYVAVMQAKKRGEATEQQTALVHVKSDAVEKYVASKWGDNMKAAKLKSNSKDTAAYLSGWSDGKAMADGQGKKKLTD
jgi:hypothetical protein